MATKAATKRAVTVLVRYEMKQDCPEKGLHKGDVVLYIENDKGVRYYTTLRRNKAHACTCKSVKPCYHIKQMVERENARFEAAKAATKVVVLPTPLVVSPREQVWSKDLCCLIWSDTREIVDPEAHDRDVAKSHSMTVEQLRELRSDLGTKGALNGNRGFSLLKVS